MGYNNIFLGTQDLSRNEVGFFGLSWILFFKQSDISSWPEVDPVTGVINAALTFKSGARFYSAQFIQKDRMFKESQKETQAGSYVETVVMGSLAGGNLQHIIATTAMMGDRFGLLIQEQNGVQRLVGNPDAGAKFTWDYQSGETTTSRKRDCQWTFESPFPVPFYQSGSVIVDGNNIPLGGISVGGSTLPGGGIVTPAPPTAGTFALLTRFTVGPAAAMKNGDVTFTSAGLLNKNVIVMANGMPIPQLPDGTNPADFANTRYVQKVTNQNTLTINGGVVAPEIIEIFIYS